MASATKTANERILTFLQKKGGTNSFSVKQGRRLFGVQNITARISELRQAGVPIATSMVRRKGERVAMYSLGTQSKA